MSISKTTIIIKVLSKFHLFGAISYLYAHNLLDCRIIILSDFHVPSNRFRVLKEDCKFINFPFEFYYIDKSFSLSDLGKFNNLIVMNAMSVPYNIIISLFRQNTFRRIKCVLFDEGMGTYCDKRYWYNYRRSVWKKSTIVFYIKDFFVMFLCKILRIICIDKIEKFTLFYLLGGALHKNKQVINAYNYFFENVYPVQNQILQKEYNILFISDCLNSYLKNQEDEIPIYNFLISKVREKYANATIYFKPHPSEINDGLERFKDLDCEVLNISLSAEDLFKTEEISLVVGLGTTSLMTSALFFNIKTICLMDYLPMEKVIDSKLKFILQYKKWISELEEICKIL
ncbi:MAG: hypothetical protein J6K96_06815 [Treponema sp.]|nr:hypothetical protein [Treponema sp.]